MGLGAALELLPPVNEGDDEDASERIGEEASGYVYQRECSVGVAAEVSRCDLRECGEDRVDDCACEDEEKWAAGVGPYRAVGCDVAGWSLGHCAPP